MSQIIDYITQAEVLITAIVALIITAIAAYKRIKDEIARAELTKATNELIGIAEEHPQKILQALGEPLSLNVPINSNEGKNNIVAKALMQKEPALLKKLKLKDVAQVGSWVHTAYKAVKPLIKGLQK